MLARVPIRLRLALAFALVMAIVISITGLFVYLRLASALDHTINAGLRSRADVVAALVRQADTGLSEGRVSSLAARGESFAQVLDRTGRVFDTTPQLGRRPLIAGSSLARATARTTLIEHGPLAGIDTNSRLLATPVRAQGRQLVVVVGASLEARDEALRGLTSQLLIGGSAALLVASLAGYGLARAALRPVESMRARAAGVTAAEPGVRLPVPPADDEIRRLGDTLNAMLARLEGAFDRERSFVADASHELRTPLALLKAELELALREKGSLADHKAALRSAVEETDRMSQLAEDLLVLARADQGRLPVRRESVAAREILEGVAQRFALRAQQPRRDLTVEPAGNPLVLGDRLRLEQAVANLVDNALRHGAGPIQLRVKLAGANVELHVLDEGPGVPMSFTGHAFERFSRPDEARRGGGAGLGLAIVDVIARAHQGSAHIANRREGGLDAWITIPLSYGVLRPARRQMPAIGAAVAEAPRNGRCHDPSIVRRSE